MRTRAVRYGQRQATDLLVVLLSAESAGRKVSATEIDWRVRFNPVDERNARALAFNGGNYPQEEWWRLLRLALKEIDCLRDDLAAVSLGESGGQQGSAA